MQRLDLYLGAMQIAIFTTGGTIDKVYFDAKGQFL